MHTLNIHLDEQVHNLTHYGCDPHSIANLERARLLVDAEDRRAATSRRLTFALTVATCLASLFAGGAAFLRS